MMDLLQVIFRGKWLDFTVTFLDLNRVWLAIISFIFIIYEEFDLYSDFG